MTEFDSLPFNIKYIHVPQVSPVYPALQVHEYDDGPFTQLPYEHGLFTQSVILI